MPETAGNASNGEHLEDSAPRPETGTHGADSGEEAKDAINESDGPSLLDMDAPRGGAGSRPCCSSPTSTARRSTAP